MYERLKQLQRQRTKKIYHGLFDYIQVNFCYSSNRLASNRLMLNQVDEIYKENIWTMDSKGELLITIMSSLAQEESRSISENVTWGQRKRFADGKVSLPYGQFLGYRKGADGLPEIIPEEAEIVRSIFQYCHI